MAALAQLTTLTAGITSRAPLWDGDPGDVPGDAAFYHHDLIEKYGMDYMGPTRAGVEAGENPPPGSKIPTAADDARGLQRLMTTRRLIDGVFKDFDLAVVPTTIMAAPKINDALEHEVSQASGAKPKKVYDFFTADSGCQNTYPFDSFGIPAISVPCGFTQAGLPVGLMIAGPHFAEGKVLALAYAYQQSTSWHTRSPSLTADTPVPPIVEKVDAEKEKKISA
jgi:aspartyl-tRNA(Asn)/glutamyl-tRNA(Gln) amidotransferase subunit A